MPGAELNANGNGNGGETAAEPPRKLLIAASGSIAVLALANYVFAARTAGVARIAVVMSPTAERMLPAATLRHVCDAVHGEDDPGPGHVALGRWPDHVLVLPATAHTLGCLAQGLAPSLLTATLASTDAPITVVPAMNPAMWRKPAVQRNVAALRGDGHRVLDPLPGLTYEVASRALVDGTVMPPPELVLAAITASPPAPIEDPA